MELETETKTANVLAGMFTENTGQHPMDSGGAYGRHWQRAAGMEAKDFLAQPQGKHEIEYESFTLDLFHYLNSRLSFTAEAELMTNKFRQFVESQDIGDSYYNAGSTMEEFLVSYGIPEDKIKGYNTYNWDSLLDQGLQFYNWHIDDEAPGLVAISLHNGADIRGGYTDFVFFEFTNPYWIHGSTECVLECDKCNGYGSHGIGFDEYWHGDFADFELSKGCPECKSELTVFYSEDEY